MLEAQQTSVASVDVIPPTDEVVRKREQDPVNRQAREALLNETLYTADGRKTIEQLYEVYDQLEAEEWDKELVYTQTIFTHEGREISYPVYAYSWKGSSQQSLWILGGVHGEEPAGPNAFANRIDIIKNLKNSAVSTVFIPLLSPVSYYRDWRYFQEPRNRDKGSSVSDSDHILLNDNGEPRLQQPANEFAKQLLEWVIDKQQEFPVLVAFDHHEDLLEWLPNSANNSFSYSYANGDLSTIGRFLKPIAEALTLGGSPTKMSGETDFGEEITDGFVLNTKDGSIDEALSATKVIKDGQIIEKQGAAAVFVLETTRIDEVDQNLEKRRYAHEKVMELYMPIYLTLLSDLLKKNIYH